MSYLLPGLPYAYDALEPHIDGRTMEIHHTKHHAGYVSKLNAAAEGYDLENLPIGQLLSAIDTLPDEIRTAVRNHGGGHANHSLFWTVLSGRGGGQPKGELAKAIDEEFGGFDRFSEQLTRAAMERFDSGWAWLVLDAQEKLVVQSTPNQDSPLMSGHTPILGVDVWEHAYYLQYQNRRADYLKAFFNVIHWDAVNELYLEAIRREAYVGSR